MSASAVSASDPGVTPGAAIDFGTAPDGSTVRRVAIGAGRLSATLMTWGAGVQDLRIRGHDAPLVLGFDTFEPYLSHSPYFGVTAGRYANRIGRGRFTLDGERHVVDANENGRACLHGGSLGTGQRNWTLVTAGGDHATFTLLDPDGWMGFPGDLSITVDYRVTPQDWLVIGFEATSSAPTLCNLAHHSYFNLDDGGAGPVTGHRMTIAAGAYTPVDSALIPTGEVLPVEGTPFDFVVPREIGGAVPYDHNWCLSAGREPLRQAAWLQGAHSGVDMEVWTTEPGLQFYAGHGLDVAVPGLGGRRYGPNAGLCLEAQVWPDAPNKPWFPQAVLRPGETYRQETHYRFRLP